MNKSLVFALVAMGIGFGGAAMASPLATASTMPVANSDDGVTGTVAQTEAEKKKKKKQGAGSGSDQRGS